MNRMTERELEENTSGPKLHPYKQLKSNFFNAGLHPRLRESLQNTLLATNFLVDFNHKESRASFSHTSTTFFKVF